MAVLSSATACAAITAHNQTGSVTNLAQTNSAVDKVRGCLVLREASAPPPPSQILRTYVPEIIGNWDSEISVLCGYGQAWVCLPCGRMKIAAAPAPTADSKLQRAGQVRPGHPVPAPHRIQSTGASHSPPARPDRRPDLLTCYLHLKGPARQSSAWIQGIGDHIRLLFSP